MRELVRRHHADRLAGGDLGGEIADAVVVEGFELQQGRQRGQRLAAERTDPVALDLGLPNHKIMVLQAAEDGVELDRVDVAELLADLGRADVGRVDA